MKAKSNRQIEVKSFESPEEVRKFEKGKLELLKVGGVMIGRGVFEPGWRWSQSVKSIAKTESCQAPHFQYQVSGRMRIRTDDGTERDTKAGDVVLLGAGHDAWVIGDEPVIVVDFQGMVDYAKSQGQD